MLQDCFENNDWNMFKDSSTQDSSVNIEEYTEPVYSFEGFFFIFTIFYIVEFKKNAYVGTLSRLLEKHSR
jgi:DNA helicase IV